MDLRGKVLTARVRLDSGLGPNAATPGGVKLYVKSGSGYVLADAGWVNLTTGQDWVTLTLPLDNPTGWVQPASEAGTYDASDIRLIGLDFETGATAADWSGAVVHIDTVGLVGELPTSTSGSTLPEMMWTFDDGLENWNIGYTNPATMAETSTLVFDQTVGEPDPGSLKLTIPFSGLGQVVEALVVLPMPMDLTGKTLAAKVKLDSGLSTDPATFGGVKLFVKSGSDFIWADGGWTDLAMANGWSQISLVLDAPIGMASGGGIYSAADIRVIGLSFATPADVGTGLTTAIIHVDTVGVISETEVP